MVLLNYSSHKLDLFVYEYFEKFVQGTLMLILLEFSFVVFVKWS